MRTAFYALTSGKWRWRSIISRTGTRTCSKIVMGLGCSRYWNKTSSKHNFIVRTSWLLRLCLQMNQILVFIILSFLIMSNQPYVMGTTNSVGCSRPRMVDFKCFHGQYTQRIMDIFVCFFYIYVNYDVLEGTFGETDNNQNDFDSDSESMVVSLNVYNVNTRSSMACNTYIISDMKRRTSFPGWVLNWNA